MGGSYQPVDVEPIMLENETNQQAVQGLQDLINNPVTMPQVSLQGLTGQGQSLLNTGMSILSQLQNLAQNPPEALKIGLDYIKNVLSGSYDPMSSPYYQGIKEEAKTMTQDAIDLLRQGQQIRGVVASTPGMRAESNLRTGMNAKTLQTLGQLYENERNRMTTAGSQALAYANYQPSILSGAMSGIGALSPLATYNSDVANKEAMFNAQLQGQGLLANQQNQLGALSTLADYGTYYVPPVEYKPGLGDYILGGLGAAGSFIGK